MKCCSKCKIEKDEKEFYPDRRRKKGLQSKCKDCDNLMRKNSHINNPKKGMIRNCRVTSKSKKIPFDITEEDIFIPEICPVLGIPLKVSELHVSHSSPSIDRIIPSKGYVKGNIIVVSYKANTIKNNATPEEIIAVGQFYKKLLEEIKESDIWQKG